MPCQSFGDSNTGPHLIDCPMLDDAKELPNDPAALKGLVASEVEHQALFIEKLKHQLAGMR